MRDLSKRLDELSPEKRALLEARLKKNQGGTLPSLSTIPQAPRVTGTAFPLSYGQQRLWFLDQLEPGNPFYNEHVGLRFSGRLNVAALEQSLNEIRRRHEILRTTFRTLHGEPAQFINSFVAQPLPVLDLRAVPEIEREAQARDLAFQEVRRSFDLTRGQLIRFKLLWLAEEAHSLLVTVHHIVADRWSIAIFIREMCLFYEGFSEEKASAPRATLQPSLPDLPLQYVDFAVWQRQWLQGAELQTQLDTWKQRLRGIPSVLDLPTDRPRPSVQSYRGARHATRLPAALTQALKALSRQAGVTLFMTLLAAWQTLLHRYTGREDIVVGSPILNRNRVELEGMIGIFLNMLALRVDLSGNPRFRELLERVHHVAVTAYAHQELPFEKLVDELQPERSLSHAPIFQVAFSYLTVAMPSLKLPGLNVNWAKNVDGGVAKFDLDLSVEEIDGALALETIYATDLFDGSTIERLTRHFQILLEGIVADPERRLSELPLLSEAELRNMLEGFNATQATYPQETLLTELIEAQAERTPEAVAIVFENEQVTYAALDRRAGQLAHHLRGLGVGPGSRVGLYLERSPELVVGLLGVLKAGGAYVPLDPAYPAERLAFMLEDSQASVLLTQSQLLIAGRWPLVTPTHNHPSPTISPQPLITICLDADWETIANYQQSPSANNQPSDARRSPKWNAGDSPQSPTPDSLAYVIYTSGSTGRPKGVQISQRALVNFLYSIQNQPGLTSADVLLSVTTVAFDIFGLEVYLPLLSGARVEIVSREIAADGIGLRQKLTESSATVMQATPATWRLLLEAGWSGSPGLKILCGGEAFPQSLAERLLAGGAALWNLYGPTETTIWSSVERIEAGHGPIVIGRPMANTQFYILDQHGQPVPIGVIGELHIGGDGLAQGYLNRPDLTAEKFVPNPFVMTEDEGRTTNVIDPSSFVLGHSSRLYRTGDLARYHSDGKVEVVGRVDHQVKVRGFRIELGEIEAALISHPAVSEAVVIARGSRPPGGEAGQPTEWMDDKRLVAYVVPRFDALDENQVGTPWQTEQLAHWQTVYEEMYLQAEAPADPTFNLASWNSIYTGLPIPAEEMHSWVETTVERVRSLQPRRVLEIGCGVGLLLFRLAPACERYYGTDFSEAALDYLQRQLAAQPLSHVSLLRRSAEDFSGLEPGSFDLILLNSVVQYFPSIDYLVRMLEGAVKVLAPGGRIFLGDVRNYLLLEALHTSVQFAQAPDDLPASHLRQRVRKQINQEEELLVAPGFFSALLRHLPQLTRVELQLKRGRTPNELNKFRYDVILHTAEAVPLVPEGMDWDWQSEGQSLETVHRELVEEKPSALTLRRIPNARLFKDLRTLALLNAESPAATVGELRAALPATPEVGVDPEIFWELGDRLSYTVEIRWSGPEMDSCYDVVFRSKSAATVNRTPPPGSRAVTSESRLKPWRAYANTPLRGMFTQRLAPELRTLLQAQLPEYMLPSAFVLLEALPLTPNGKVDRKALPMPETDNVALGSRYVAPSTPTQQWLAEIWTQVLGVKRVGVEDNFFELGGHSLLATQVISRVRQAFRVEVPVRQIFETPTVSGLAKVIRQHRRVSLDIVSGSRTKAARQTPKFLSYAQQRLWFLDQLEPGSVAYNIPAVVRLRGHLEVTALEASLNKVVQRHEMLRTTFQTRAGRPVQVIALALKLTLAIQDLSRLPETERAAQLTEHIRQQTQSPFDLARGPLLRVTLYRMQAEAHVLILLLHHIVSDGWSLGVLIREVATLYGAEMRGEQPILAELPVQYADYAAWQREWLEAEGALEAQLAYWRSRLANVPVLQLPSDRPRSALPAHHGAAVKIKLPEELSKGVSALAQAEGATTPFMVLLAAFQALLARYSGQVDLTVGTPVANRTQAEVEGLIGFFVNTLVLRTDLSGDPSFRELLGRVREVALGAYVHQDLPFERLVEELQPERSLSHTPLFQVMFVLQNAPLPPLELPGLHLELEETPTSSAKYDLTLSLQETSHGFSGSLEYNTDLFDPATMERLVGHFETLLAGAIANPACQLWALPLLTEAEREQFRERRTKEPLSNARWQGHCLPELVEAQVERTPEAIAGVYEDQQLTYRELNRRADQLAAYLRDLGVKPEVCVGLYLERSLEMLIAIVGIHKAGGAYLPLDLAYPPERLAFMLEDSQARVLITQSHLLKSLGVGDGGLGTGISTICLDTDWPSTIESLVPNPQSPIPDPQAPVPDSLAYVIYTSGSTGQPKGTLVSQANVVRLFESTQAWYQFSADDVWTLFHSHAFDFSVWEIWGALLYGGRLVVVPYWVSRSPESFYDLLMNEGVTILNQTPSAFRQLIQAETLRNELDPLRLRQVIFGGEALELHSLQPWLARHGDAQPELVNMYGITETTVHVTYRPLTELDIRSATGSVIGHPIPDLEVYILDRYLQPTPIGVPGELYVGGAGVARGYLSRPELTAEKFIPNPFVGTQEKAQGARLKAQGEASLVLGPWALGLASLRLYRTGDLARYLANGDIEYLGRIDHQVKIRGFRIELGEIEAALNSHPAIRESLVLAQESSLQDVTHTEAGGKRLVAYLVSQQGNEPSASELRTCLHARLPDYMIPSVFIWLEAFPLTPNGKVDRQALPTPEDTQPPGVNYVAPRTSTEQQLAEIWAKVLGIEKVGAEDNFFELGGHSLLATQVVNRVRRALRVELQLRSLFEAPTLAGLAEIVGRADPLTDQRLAAVAPVSRTGELPLSYGQQRLWFLDRLTPGSAAYNVPTVVRLRGTLEVTALAASLNKIVQRHEVLRTTFQAIEGRPQLIISPARLVPLEREDLRGGPAESRIAEVQARVEAEYNRPFDLSRGPLLRVRLIQVTETEHVLILVLHHIVSDGWSMGVLVREVAAEYSAYVEGQSSLLPELPIQYVDYAAWQRDWLEDEGLLEAQLAYWQNRLVNVPVLQLPTDRPRLAMQSYHGARVPVQLPASLSREINGLAQREGVTPFMVLLTAFQALLGRYSRQTDFGVGTPVANRTRAEIEGLIGFFVNTLVLRADLTGNPSFRELLGRVREACLQAYANQNAPFERVVEAVQPERRLSHTPLFQAMFVLQNAPLPKLELPGLDLELMESGAGTIKFDLTLILDETPDGFVGALEYNTDLFDRATIERWLGHFETFLAGAIAKSDQRLSALPLLTEAERRQVVEEWNETAATCPAEKCIQEIFENQAAQTPEAIALVNIGEADQVPQHLSYAELNRRADQLALYLQGQGVGPETPVGLCLKRSLEMVIGLWAVLKAGGAYVPLDPDYPPERLAFMLEDSRAAVILAQSQVLEHLKGAGDLGLGAWDSSSIICLDTEWETITKTQPPAPRPQSPTPDSLAYIIYTSGSTGRPKGVLVSHRGLVNLAWAQIRAFGVWPDSRVLQFASFSFDASVSEVAMALLAGATLCLAPSELLLPGPKLIRVLRDQAITTVTFPPSLLSALLSDDLPRLETIITAGEACSAEIAARWSEGRRFINAYGPTELTVCATLAEQIKPGETPPIGRPLANTQIYLLDQHLQPVPIGMPGELFLGGLGVARGYLGQPELTAEKFIPNPFITTGDERRKTKDERRATNDEGPLHETNIVDPSSFVLGPSSRLYRTGDLARYLPDGNLEFLGRVDHQVKLRGYRIESGEIESILREHPGVQQAVVMLREDAPGDKRLVAYFVPQAGQAPALSELRSWLQKRLPEYMLPSAFVVLETIPLTPTGKIDRKALPAPEPEHLALSSRYVAPRTLAEELIVEIWSEVLQVERVGIYDNFFELGGHSLLATQVIARIYQAFGVEIPLRFIFETPTVADVTRAVEQSRGKDTTGRASSIVPVPRDQVLLPSPAQQRMWFFDQLVPGDPGQNISAALHVRGRLDLKALEWAFNEIVRRHETLRTAFVTVDGQPILAIEPAWSVVVPLIDLCNLPEAEREAQARRLAAQEAGQGFDLTRGALLRVKALRLAETDHAVLLTLHHIISDGWSMNVMREEFAALYRAFSQGWPTPLAPLPIQYADYAAWLRTSSQTGILDEHFAYWRHQLRGDLPVLELPTDRPRPAVMGGGGALRSWQFSATEVQALKALSNREGATPFMVLLAVFQTLLHRYTGQTDILVGSPVAGRVRVETEQLIGCFINPLPLRGDLSGDPTFRELLQRAREVTLGAYVHQEMPLEVIVQTIKVQRQLSHMPLFQTLFVMQNFPVQTLHEGDLQFEVMDVEIQAAGFDLTLVAWEIGPELHGVLGYRADLFETATIDRMLIHFRTLLLEAVAHPDQRLSQLALMPEAEKHLVVEAWNSTQREWPAWQPFHQLVEAYVAEQPEAVALVWPGKQAAEDQHITYGELNRRATQLAHYLQSLGVGPEVRVGICLERSPELVVALLGVLKAGGAYVSCDPFAGQERLAYMLEDSQVAVLLTQSHLLNGAGGWGLGTDVSVICLDTDWEIMISSQSPTPRRSPKRSEGDSPQSPAPDSLAYLIYTSGSTGRPKGVMVSQANIVNAYRAWELAYGLRTDVRSHLQMANFAFDVFTGDVVRALGSGAKLVLCPSEWLLEPERLYGLMQRQAVEGAEFVPAVLRPLMAYLERNGKSLDFMHLLVVGSDVWQVRDHQALPRLGSETTRWINSYGVTEAAIDSAFFEGSVMELPAESVAPIGRPLANVQVYVLDDQLQPTPVNVPGELYIGGQGVARGYWGRPDLTAERFVPNPFIMTDNGGPLRATDDELLSTIHRPPSTVYRLYKTSDRARWRADGSLEFLGRADEQVKVRGYRIEPGEIEAVLAGHPAVKECAVMAREYSSGDKRLIAYVVAEPLTEEVPLQLTCEMEFEDGHREAGLTEAIVLGEECQVIVAGSWASGLTLRLHLPSVGNGYGVTGQVIWQENERTRLSLSLSPDERAILQQRLVTIPALNSLRVRNLRDYLKGKLPSYMLPSAITLLDKLPRTPSGKVDRQALPAPTSLSIEKTQSYVAPRTPREEKVAGIWAEVLQLERVGVEDNFFEMGGHSLLATQVISRVREAFGAEVPLLELFAEPTVAGLAAAVERAESAGRVSQMPAITPVARKSRRVKLSPRGELTNLKAPQLDEAE